MIGLIQRVTRANVVVNKHEIASIKKGVLLLLGVEREDSIKQVERLLQRVITYRIFEDETGRMNKSLLDIKGELLIVPQFTLPADTNKGTRPSFHPAASPDLGRQLFDCFVQRAESKVEKVEMGKFGSDMQVELVNNGPVTFWLHC
jgi:D-tyrosyl-tRNA(Tyr) deacylase